jgi:anti-anti-sigma factor
MTTGGLSVSVDSIVGVPVVRLRGSLTIDADLAALREAVSRPDSQAGAALVLDLADVHACDSSGVGALVDLRLKSDRPVVLFRPSEHLRRVLHVMKVMSIFEVMDDEESLGPLRG